MIYEIKSLKGTFCLKPEKDALVLYKNGKEILRFRAVEIWDMLKEHLMNSPEIDFQRRSYEARAAEFLGYVYASIIA